MMWFKEYEIWPIDGTKNFELDYWTKKTSKIVLAFLDWNENEGSFDIRSVGFRLIEKATPEMMEWLLHWRDHQSFVNKVR